MKISAYYSKLKSILGLSLQLAKANFKLKNEGSYLGIFWYLLNPFFTFVILFFIRDITAKGIENYPLYLLLGIIMAGFFQKTTSQAIGTITSNAGLIKSIRLDCKTFVIATVLENAFSHFFEVLLFVVFLIYLKASVLYILFYAIIFIIFCIFVLGVSFMVSAIGTYINDFGNIWAILTNLLWFATPIFYSDKINIHGINAFNPIYYFITIAREIIIYHKTPKWELIIAAITFSFAFFMLGILIFEKLKYKFAEKI